MCATESRHDSWSLVFGINYYRKHYATFWSASTWARARAREFIRPFSQCNFIQFDRFLNERVNIYSLLNSRLLLAKRVPATNCTHNQCAKRIKYTRFSTQSTASRMRQSATHTRKRWMWWRNKKEQNESIIYMSCARLNVHTQQIFGCDS